MTAKTTSVIDGDLKAVAAHLCECAFCHEEGSRLIGNARAVDIGNVAAAYLALSGELADRRPLHGEAYFIDRDNFLQYVADEVNPPRLAEGLDAVSSGAASHLFDVITSQRYRR